MTNKQVELMANALTSIIKDSGFNKVKEAKYIKRDAAFPISLTASMDGKEAEIVFDTISNPANSDFNGDIIVYDTVECTKVNMSDVSFDKVEFSNFISALGDKDWFAI